MELVKGLLLQSSFPNSSYKASVHQDMLLVIAACNISVAGFKSKHQARRLNL